MGTVLELCRIDDVLNLPGADELRRAKTIDTATEESIAQMILDFSTAAEKICSREFLLDTRTQVCDVDECARILRLRAYPVKQVTSVKESSVGDFASATAVPATSYGLRMQGRNGMLERRYAYWPAGVGTVEVVYQGGLAATTDVVPADLRMAAALQVLLMLKQNPTLHLRSQGMSEGSASFFEGKSLLPHVAATLWRYTRKG